MNLQIIREPAVIIRMLTMMVVFCFSCSKAPGVRISQAGHFPSPSKTKVLFVKVDSKGVVNFAVRKLGASEDIVAEEAGSTHQRWFFYWESDQFLWVQSSDLGTLKIIKFKPDGSVSENKVLKRQDKELGIIPRVVKDGLSNTLTKSLGM